MKTTLLIPLLILATLLTPMTGSANPRGQIVAIDNSVFVAMVDPSIEDCILHTGERQLVLGSLHSDDTAIQWDPETAVGNSSPCIWCILRLDGKRQ